MPLYNPGPWHVHPLLLCIYCISPPSKLMWANKCKSRDSVHFCSPHYLFLFGTEAKQQTLTFPLQNRHTDTWKPALMHHTLRGIHTCIHVHTYTLTHLFTQCTRSCTHLYKHMHSPMHTYHLYAHTHSAIHTFTPMLTHPAPARG